MPQEHEDQMQLGMRMIQTAFQSKSSALENEIRGLRMTCEEQRSQVQAMQKKGSALELELVESHQRSQQLAEENKELFKTVGNLRKQVARLDSLKQAVLGHVQNDHQLEAENSYEHRALMNDEYLKNTTPLTFSSEMGYGQSSAREYGQSAAPSARSVTPPPPAPFAGTSASTPQAAGSGVGGIDGKEFFRRARSQLSYEAFNLFLASIKRLNNQQQSREDTLEEARNIFGTELQDLYRDFETLLNRHGM